MLDVQRRVWLRFAILVVTVIQIPVLAQAPKKKITRPADIPQSQYAISGKGEGLVAGAEGLRTVGGEVRRNTESILSDCEIDVASTKRGLLAVMSWLGLVDHQSA